MNLYIINIIFIALKQRISLFLFPKISGIAQFQFSDLLPKISGTTVQNLIYFYLNMLYKKNNIVRSLPSYHKVPSKRVVVYRLDSNSEILSRKLYYSKSSKYFVLEFNIIPIVDQ